MSTFDKQFNAEKLSVHILRDSISLFLLNRGHAAKISDIVREVGAEYSVGAKLIRALLSADDSFVCAERRFNFKYRTDFNRPLDGDIKSVMNGIGLPLELDNLANELALLNIRSQEYFLDLLPKFVKTREDYFLVDGEHYGLNEWLLVAAAGDDKDTVLDINFFDNYAEIQADLDKATAIKLKGANLLEKTKEIVAEIGPVNHKILSFALWNALGDAFSSMELYKELFAHEDFTLLSGQDWALTDSLKATSAKLKKLSDLADKELVDEEECTGDYTVNFEDMAEINDYCLETQSAERLTDIITHVLEYGEDNPRFKSIYETLLEEMSLDKRFERVGEETFALQGLIPEEVTQVPDELLPAFVDSSLYSDPEADIELVDEGLEADLAALIHDPYYEDFGGEHEVELSEDVSSLDKKTVFSLTYPHRLMGTLKLRQMDIPFFPSETSYAALTVKDGDDTFKMWLNNEELIITNLSAWYAETDAKVGSQITFKKLDTADCYSIALEPKLDMKIEIPEDRVAELSEMISVVANENWSMYEIVTKILSNYKLGLNFYNIWSEANVIRRAPKRVIASILSYYEGFAVTKAGNWKFDAKKLGKKRTDKDEFVM